MLLLVQNHHYITTQIQHFCLEARGSFSCSDFATFALPVDFTLDPAEIGPSGASVARI